MVMCFTCLIYHSNDHLHLAPSPLWHRLFHSPGINLGIYNIWDGRVFVLPQAICSIKQGNYDLVLLTEKKIPDAVYCHNRLRYDVICSDATVTTSK